MPIENEHKYLVEKVPFKTDPKHISQFYIAHDKDRKLIQRARMTNSDYMPPSYEVAHKIGSGESCVEVEYGVTADVFEELRSLFSIGNVVDKVRYVNIIGGLKWDIDVYVNGMITAEIENPPESYDMSAFGKHVDLTGDFKFSNYKLATIGYPEYKHLL